MLVRVATYRGVLVAQYRESSHQRGGLYDEWKDWKMPKWATDLYNDPSYLIRKKDEPVDRTKKKALWRRLWWNRDFEEMIPQDVDDVRTMDNPTLWHRIRARFNRIPLKGEAHAPTSLFDDYGKVFYPGPEYPPMPKDYKEHPERDLVNFPYPSGPFYPPKVRMLMFPDAWFQPFYNVTGVSGPYLFLGGIFAFILSKEILVMNEDYDKTVYLIGMYLFLHCAFSHRLQKRLYKNTLDDVDAFYKIKQDELKSATEFRKQATQITQSLKMVKENFPTILRENLALQLEAGYRRNIQRAYQELKKRLDYLSEVEETRERFEREIFFKTIADGVRKQIEANENKIRERYLDNCILQLSELGQQQK